MKPLSPRALATVVTLLIGVGMALVLIVVNRVALLLPYGGDLLVSTATALTVVVELALFLIVWALVYEIILARRERDEENLPIPTILTGLLSLYVLVAWLFLATTLSRAGKFLRLALLADGYTEPESQVFRTVVILLFVGISFYYFVYKHRARTVARLLWNWFARVRRGTGRQDGGGE